MTQKLYDFEVIQDKNNTNKENKDNKRILSFVKVSLFIISSLLGFLYLRKTFILFILFILLIVKKFVEYIIFLIKNEKKNKSNK